MDANNRKLLAQNFLNKAHLAASLLNDSSIDPTDIVYEIGPGKGVLTRELARRAKKVIAIEKDRELYKRLKERFKRADNIILYNVDFLKYRISESCYKIFANIPFNITSAIIRKIVHIPNQPVEAYLIMQKEAAEKFSGAVKTTQFSVLLKPWFQLKIIRSFKRTDFSPVSGVDIVMLHIEKRTLPLVMEEDISVYEGFIKQGFNAWKKNLKLNYKNFFTYQQWKRLSHDLGFAVHAKPSELHFRQWLGLFDFFTKKRRTGCNCKKTALARGF